MSYNKSPKTRYGDTDFSQDSWSPQDSIPPPAGLPNYGTPSTPTQYPGLASRGVAAGGMSQAPYSQGPMDAMQQGQTGQSLSQLAAVANTITQEDILFMRTWQRDSFYYRVIPFEVMSLGSLYMYTKTKGIPHSIPKYMGMAFAAFIFGKWTYRDEFKRRLAESRLNTPYAQALRRTFGVAPLSSEFADPVYGGTTELDPWNNAGSSFEPETSYTGDRQFGSGQLQPELFGPDRVDNQTTDEEARPRMTYDELRAKNRGFIK